MAFAVLIFSEGFVLYVEKFMKKTLRSIGIGIWYLSSLNYFFSNFRTYFDTEDFFVPFYMTYSKFHILQLTNFANFLFILML